MLKKLLKYDWKFFWKVPAIINLALGIITLLGIMSFISPLWDIDSDFIIVLMEPSLLFYYVSVFAGSIAISVYTAVRFYRNLYTDEGYLTNTLPVTPRQIILSKLLVSALWSLITGLVIIASIVLLVVIGGLVSIDADIFTIFSALQDVWIEFDELFAEYGFHPIFFMLLLCLYAVISTFFNILLLFAAISLGQIFSRHKIIGAIFWYFLEYIIIQFGSSIAISMITFTYFDNDHLSLPGMDSFFTFLNLLLGVGIVLMVACCAGLYFLTEHMLKRRLNLD